MRSTRRPDKIWRRKLVSKQQLKEVLHKTGLNRKDKLVLILASDNETPKAIAEMKRLGIASGLREISGWNVADILANMPSLAIKLPEGWALTSEGRNHCSKLGVLEPTITSQKSVAVSLRQHLATVGNKETASFLEEAINCYEAKLYRAAVVFSWVGAVSVLFDCVIKNHLPAFNAEALRIKNDWKPVKTKDGLSLMKESEFLDILASPSLGILGKNVKEELKNVCLALRNACGHPNSFVVGENKAAAHIEVLMLNVFTKF